MVRPLVIYHADCVDGFAAAYAIYARFRQGDSCPCDFVAAAHGLPPPEAAGREVYIVDFSYRRRELKELCRTALSVTVIDHHITAARDLADLEKEHNNLRLILNMEKSGAVLTWEYFHDLPPPGLLLHVQDRDLWRFVLKGTNDIHAALMVRPFDFRTWTELAAGSDVPTALIAEGEAINRYRHKMIDMHRREAVTASIAGYQVPVVNCYEEIASDLLGELAMGHPFAAGYHDVGILRKWSLRSSAAGIDVAEIAERFGGGGHQHSAGFTTRLPDAALNITVW